MHYLRIDEDELVPIDGPIRIAPSGRNYALFVTDREVKWGLPEELRAYMAQIHLGLAQGRVVVDIRKQEP